MNTCLAAASQLSPVEARKTGAFGLREGSGDPFSSVQRPAPASNASAHEVDGLEAPFRSNFEIQTSRIKIRGFLAFGGSPRRHGCTQREKLVRLDPGKVQGLVLSGVWVRFRRPDFCSQREPPGGGGGRGTGNPGPKTRPSERADRETGAENLEGSQSARAAGASYRVRAAWPMRGRPG